MIPPVYFDGTPSAPVLTVEDDGVIAIGDTITYVIEAEFANYR